MTAEIVDYQPRLVAVSETLCLPEENDIGLGIWKERARNNALLKQKLWSYVRHHGL
jgi:hypothetical protein